MLLVTQNCNHAYFTDNDDCLEVQGKDIVLVRGKRYLRMGTYESMDRAVEVLKDVVRNIDSGGLIFPER